MENNVDQLLTIIGRLTVEPEMLRAQHAQALNIIKAMQEPSVAQPMAEQPRTIGAEVAN